MGDRADAMFSQAKKEGKWREECGYPGVELLVSFLSSVGMVADFPSLWGARTKGRDALAIRQQTPSCVQTQGIIGICRAQTTLLLKTLNNFAERSI